MRESRFLQGAILMAEAYFLPPLFLSMEVTNINLPAQARTSSTGFRGTISATRAMIFLFCSAFFRS